MMTKTELGSCSKYVIMVMQLSLLCACSIFPPKSQSPQAVPATSSTSTKSAAAAVPTVASPSVLNEHNVIVPSPGIEKDGLLVSYSMKIMPYSKVQLLQVSLVFRNMSAKDMMITPKVTMTQDNGVAVTAYTKGRFDRLANRMIAHSKRAAGKQKNAAERALQEQLEWHKAFWLGKRFRIPADGIQIGGLVFHSGKPVYPLKLVVHSSGRVFQFIIKDPVGGLPEKKPEAKKALECHSPALGTALYVGSDPACRE